jgi:hypothetical protein
MASIGNKGGQRRDTNSSSGRKQRSPTSRAASGSRVDPSHTKEKAREDRAKKTAADAAAATKKKAAKPRGSKD